MKDKNKLMIGGLTVAVIFIAVSVVAFGFANETLDVIAEMFGAHEWETWFPPFFNYEVPGFEGNLIMNFLVGVGFTALILVLTFALMWLVTRSRKRNLKTLTSL